MHLLKQKIPFQVIVSKSCKPVTFILTLYSGYWPAVVSANTPNPDAANRLSMKQSLAQWVNQVHHVIFQDHQHVLTLSEHTHL